MCSSTYLTMPIRSLPPIGFLKSIAILLHLLIGCVQSTDFLRSIVISPQIDFSRWIAILLHLPNDLRLQ
ncbi:hypothetical protein K0T89_002364 [Staphylococcus pseudintermedius]|nr:hypothetical protein [Staphylococcus pseudintermedius]